MFFFPSRRRHTRSLCDWSSDVCSSDLDQPCCGALLVHAGEEEGALALARHLINVFERAGVDAIVTNAAGCGSNGKEYAHLLRDDPQYAAPAKEFSSKCQHIREKPAYMGLRAKLH